MHSELEHEDFVETILWDMVTGERVYSMPTGTPWEPVHRIQFRRAINPFGRLVHSVDKGHLQLAWSTRWDGGKAYNTMWQECMICHKRFNIEEL